MDDESKALIRQLIASNKRQEDLLEKIAHRNGSMGLKNEERVMNILIKYGKIRKQDVVRITNTTDTGALGIMKRMGSKDDIVYIPGSGNKNSLLVYINGSESDSKAAKLYKIMEKGTKMSRLEVLVELGISEGDYTFLISSIRRLFPKDFLFKDGLILRCL